jgi:site-specific recombinase XerD
VVRPYQVLSEAEMGRVLQAVTNPRDLTIVTILLGAGLRVAELVALDVEDLHSDSEEGAFLHIRMGKGGKDRLVPVHEEVSVAIHKYLLDSGRTTASAGPLLLAQDRGRHLRQHLRVSQRAVRTLIKVLCLRARIAKPLSPHSFRHTYAIRALHHSHNLVAISKMLGHASVVTTQIYLNHLGLRELRDAVPHLPASGGQ